MNKILIVDDEKAICDSITFALEDDYEVLSTQQPDKVKEILESNNIDVVLLDLKIGNVNGIDVLREIKAIDDEVQVIIITAFGSIKSSVQAIKEGASHYITKPIDIEELFAFIKKSLEHKKISSSLKSLKQVINRDFNINGIIGRSESFQSVIEKVKKIKDLDTTVLITGESGTGKDVIAKALHFESKRSDENLEIINCAAIPADLLESELFGYEKGAFTGADKKKLGKFQLADKGTLFLDEIGEMDLGLQSKILRVVEDMTVTPLGGEKGVKINTRIVAATNKDLEEQVKQGNFREDLYYRLNVITLELPSLRERVEDISLLLNYFLNRHNEKLNKNVKYFEAKVIRALENYEFPGNIRELENLIERLVALSDKEYISLDDLPKKYKNKVNLHENSHEFSIGLDITLEDLEKKYIEEVLNHFEGNKKRTSESLGISERSFHYKVKKYKL